MALAQVVAGGDPNTAFAIAHRFGPGVSKQEIESVGEALLHPGPQRVVTRVARIAVLVETLCQTVKRKEGAIGIGLPGPGIAWLRFNPTN